MKSKLLALIFLTICIGCKKDPDTNDQQITGYLSLKRYHFTDYSDISPGTLNGERRNESARAEFITDNYFKDAGIVKYGDSNLHRHDFYKVYLSYKPDDPISAFNEALNGGRTWSVTGNKENKIPAFSISAPLFPSFLSAKFDTLPVIPKNQTFTISWDNTIPCDSISIRVTQSHTYVQSGIISGNISSFSFTPAQLSDFNTGYTILNNVLSIEGWTYKYIKVDGVKIKTENYAKRTCSVKFVN